jgi:hypothetical protein
VIGYVGPSRVLDASLRGDSLFIVIRRYGMGVSGPLSGEEGIDGALLRFLTTPWDFSAAPVRHAVETAAISTSAEGWSLQGTFRDARFTLALSARGEPKSLDLRRGGDSREEFRVRYGPERNYPAGRIPSWIEWSFSGSLVKLDVEDHSPADPAKIRFVTTPEPDWTIVPLDTAPGRSFVRWLLGLSQEGGGER